MKRIYNQFLKSYFIMGFICKEKKSNYFAARFFPVFCFQSLLTCTLSSVDKESLVWDLPRSSLLTEYLTRAPVVTFSVTLFKFYSTTYMPACLYDLEIKELLAQEC